MTSTNRRLFVAGGLCAIVAVASAIYTIVYLYRWEWHRAIIAACFLIASEIPLATMLVIRRLRALEAKIDALASPRERVEEILHDNPNPTRRHFAWLERSSGQMGVFIPMLLGMGTILSGLAWVIDHLARRVGHTHGDRRLAARLAVFALPDGGFVPRRDQTEAACDHES
jgi:hypothetical protein